VNFDLSDEQRLLQDTARDWFSTRYAPADMRTLLDGGANAVEHTKALAEMGFLGMLVDPAHGGGGLSVLDLAVVAEEAGRVLASVPLVSTAAHATTLLRAGATGAASGLLREIAAGRAVVAVIEGGELRATRAGETWRVDGFSPAALDATRATHLLAVAAAEAGPALLVIAPAADGVELVTPPAMDPTRALARVRFSGATGELLAVGDSVAQAADRARQVAEAILSAEDLGAAQRCLEMAVEYAQNRVAFGRPIGSFQAIKHMCVDMFTLVESLRSLVWFAAWSADGDPSQLPLATAATRAHAADAFEQCAANLIQVHGGIGFTWEHDSHLFWRRAKVDRLLFGDSAGHREAVAEMALQSIAEPRQAVTVH
jgi:alkylation response protein AidB-like acyl-CoA dehydrogenase